MKTNVILMAALMATLGACASDRSTSSADSTSASYDNPSSTAMPGATLSSKSSTSAASATSAQNWSGVVTAVDPILRQDAAAMGVGMAGAAAVGGAMQSEGSPTDKVYRVTLRADDGSTQMVVVDNMPSYKAGDRVRYRNGSVQRE